MEKLSKDDIQKGYSITKKYLKSKGHKIKTTLKDSKTKGAAEKAMEELLQEYAEAKNKEMAKLRVELEYFKEYSKETKKQLDIIFKTFLEEKVKFDKTIYEKIALRQRLLASCVIIAVLVVYGLYKSL